MNNRKPLLTCDEICKIISAGANAGISSLKFGDLSIQFGKPTEPPAQGATALPETAAPQPKPDAEMSADSHEKQNNDALILEELRTREDQIDQLLIENPVQAEQLIRDGDLEDVDDDSGDGQSESE